VSQRSDGRGLSVVIEGRHVANAFVDSSARAGDETPFRQQAAEFGFDGAAYSRH